MKLKYFVYFLTLIFSSFIVLAAQCNDHVDNDLDGYCDYTGCTIGGVFYPKDPGCSSPEDNNEFPLHFQCNDIIDNDLDGYCDYTGCTIGGIPYPKDPRCSSPEDNNEFPIDYQCSDDIDNDLDDYCDYDGCVINGIPRPKDPGCSSPEDNNEFPLHYQCNDLLDNDLDGYCDYTGCTIAGVFYPKDPACNSPEDNNEFPINTQCADGIDNDGDGYTDYPADFGCSSLDDNDERNNGQYECNNGIDDDGDGKIDQADPDCSSWNDNSESPPKPQCSDSKDNDGDSLIDVNDPGCYDSGQYNPNDNNEVDTLPDCSDFFDNDHDIYTDYPADFGCMNLNDNDEVNNGNFECNNGIDDDHDGKIDQADPDCTAWNDDSESPPKSQCSDDIDNDGDSLIDENDPGCYDSGFYSPNDNDERDTLPDCSDFFDNDHDSDIDYSRDFGCSSPQDEDEVNNGIYECNDGRDNDADGKIDQKDPDCENWFDDMEEADTIPQVFVSANVTQGLAPLSVLFNCQAVGGNQPLSYFWDFGDNTNSTTPLVEHTYTQPGNYTATCTVTDRDFDKDSDTVIIQVLPKILEITNLTCFDFVIVGGNQSCSIYVQNPLHKGEPDVDVTVYYLNGTLFGECVTDKITGGCEVKDIQNEIGNFTVYATAVKGGFINDTDTFPRFSYEVLAHKYNITDLKVFNDSQFLNEDYDFFRGENLFVSFKVLRDGQLVEDIITNATLISPPGGRAKLTEMTHGNGSYFYELRPIPLTHDFLGISQIFTFAFNFSEGSGAQAQVDLTIRNNPPFISPTIPNQELRINETLIVNLEDYENDLEDSGDDLRWAVFNPGEHTQTDLVGKLLFIKGISFGADVITLTLFDLDDDNDTQQILASVDHVPVFRCSDDIDNDGDSLIDEEDPGCYDSGQYNPNDDDETDALPDCSDFFDNDKDTDTDYPRDFGCSSPSDESEVNDGSFECNNGRDDDGDSKIDQKDPQCKSWDDNSEAPECSNKRDDDGDTLVDMADPGCESPEDDSELPFNPISCSKNSDCGINIFSGPAFCFSEDVYRLFTSYKCIAPGTPFSYCQTKNESAIFENCRYGCDKGVCKEKKALPSSENLYVSDMSLGSVDRFILDNKMLISVTLLNQGDVTFEDLSVSVAIYDLGLYYSFGSFALKKDERVTKTRVFELPYDIEPGKYDARIVISNDDIKRVIHREVTIT